jgi:hypothetical protein
MPSYSGVWNLPAQMQAKERYKRHSIHKYLHDWKFFGLW